MPTTADIAASAVDKTNVWLAEMAEELGTDDRREAYRALRAVLHVLRDRLPVNESAQLAAQLPVLIRGVYYEGWVPARVPMAYHDAESFLDRIAAEARLAGETEASYAVAAAMAVLRRHVSAGELADVVSDLPAPIRNVVAGQPSAG